MSIIYEYLLLYIFQLRSPILHLKSSLPTELLRISRPDLPKTSISRLRWKRDDLRCRTARFSEERLARRVVVRTASSLPLLLCVELILTPFFPIYFYIGNDLFLKSILII